MARRYKNKRKVYPSINLPIWSWNRLGEIAEATDTSRSELIRQGVSVIIHDHYPLVKKMFELKAEREREEAEKKRIEAQQSTDTPAPENSDSEHDEFDPAYFSYYEPDLSPQS